MTGLRTPRVAFFPDSFHEVNGVAHTSRQFTEWAARTGKPFFCVRAGGVRAQATPGSLQLPRGFASFALDRDLRYDPLFARHGAAVLEALRQFRPDLIHVTGPSEVGMLGAVMARRLGVPLAASWHTNLHEYAAHRAGWALRVLPAGARAPAAARLQNAALGATTRFYRLAHALFAPNPALCDLLGKATGRPCRLMTRGINASLFTPARRTVPPPGESNIWTLGYVGRLSIEKNVALLPRMATQLRARGFGNVRFVVIGQGAEEQALRRALPNGFFPGVLHGEALAEAYANMDCFVFPSHTDTFGNVVLEALASGVPAVVTPNGGPAHLIRASGAGLVADDNEFADAAIALLVGPDKHQFLRREARAYAARASWDTVFEDVYAGYQDLFERQ